MVPAALAVVALIEFLEGKTRLPTEENKHTAPPYFVFIVFQIISQCMCTFKCVYVCGEGSVMWGSDLGDQTNTS